MRLTRVYTPFEQGLVGQKLTITGNAHHHLLHVLRLKNDQDIMAFNGHGSAFLARIESMEKKGTVIRLLEVIPSIPESPLVIHLAQGICKGDRMDFVLQKATELGVTSITPILCERVHIKWEENRLEKKCEHWQQVIISACEQSGRNTLPSLHTPIKLDNWLSQVNTLKRFVLSPTATQAFSIQDAQGPINLLVGPEGGFSAHELDLIVHDAEFKDIHMGPRILRTETASLTALSILQFLGGDLK